MAAGSTLPDDFRLTVRRHAALSAVAELSAGGLGPCNREVSERVGIADQGHVSRLMMGLQARGLVEDTEAGRLGTRKAWRLTPHGRAVLDANTPLAREARPRGEGASVNGRATVRPDAPAPASAPVPVPVPWRGGEVRGVSGRQRGRLLEATFALVAEGGYRDLTVGMVAARAGVSRRTFYEFFSDRDDCFLAAFDHALDVLAERVLPAYQGEREWTGRVRAGLAALLEFLDGEPALRRLVFVEALAAGPQVLARRTQVLEELAGAIEGGRDAGEAPVGVPARTAQAVLGAAFGVIYGQVSRRYPESLLGLLGSLMAMIVLPYRGSSAAEAELTCPAPEVDVRRGVELRSGRPLGSGLPADFRLTVRTQMALEVVARLGARGVDPSNLQVAGLIGVSGKSTVSRMMSRLKQQGLVENTRGDTKGQQKAWRLTPHGQAVLDAHRPPFGQAPDPRDPAEVSGGKLVAKRSRPASARPASAGFRLTVRTQLVLTAVAEHAGASNREIAHAAGISDQGQISKLLARLQTHGLLQNVGGLGQGAPNAWQLTPQGEALLHTTHTHNKRAA